MRIAVAGGTGTVGRLVVARLNEAGHEPVVISRSTGIDLVHGEGLDAVLAGVDAVIDTSGPAALTARAAVEGFRTMTTTLTDAERRAGIRHHIVLSIVGIDRTENGYGYYRGKLAQEQAVAASGVPFTLLRATQFHEFARQMAQRAKVGPFVFVPRMRSQPVAAEEVAARLATLAEGAPAGRVADLAGPRVERMSQLVGRYCRAAHIPARVIEVPLPGAAGRQLRDGDLLGGPDAQQGTRTFDEWLRAEAGSDGASPSRAAKGFGGITLVRAAPPELPEPSLSNAAELIEGLATAGIPITLRVEGEPRTLPAHVDDVAFRALQEGTSLVLMRGARTEAHAVVRYLPDAVEVEVSHGPAAVPPAAQTDLARSKAAVRRLGGVTRSSDADDGSLRVWATIPAPHDR